MAPGKAHEDAIAIIKSTLKDEFQASDNDFIDYPCLTARRLRPDIFLKNPKTDRYIVVEVGNTDAEKIGVYIGIKLIEEIRWYTKFSEKQGVHLVGQWFTNELYKASINRKSCFIREKERQLKAEIEEHERRLKDLRICLDSYVCCSGCGRHIFLRQASFENYRGRDYCVCSLCEEKGYFETMSSQREALYQFIAAKRLYFEEQCKQGGLNSEKPQNIQQ